MKTVINIILAALAVVITACQKDRSFFIVSGYSSENRPDVMLCIQNGKGMPEKVSEFTIGNNPSYFALGDNGLVYFANEVDSFDMKPGGGITTLRLDRKNSLFMKEISLNQGGGGPCHIIMSNDKKYLITANYGSGSVSVVRLNREGIPERVTDVIFYGDRSHPHMTLYNPRLGIYYVSDLGLDRIHQLKLDTAIGRLIDTDVSYIKCDQGSGPRHMAIDKSRANLYVINELNSTLLVFDILSDSSKIKQAISTLPDDFYEKSFCADIHLSGNGKRLYGSNRGHNSIVIFKVGIDGRLSDPSFLSSGGDWPRNFAVTPSGKYVIVANQRSNEISVVPAGKQDTEKAISTLPFNTPACVQFLR
jgi:6-phosphogluconolactonase